MSVLADKHTRVLIQGITGTQASFHVKRSMESGTRVIAGISPRHGGEEHLGVPLFDTIREAQRQFSFDASVLFVPANGVKSAVREAIEAEIPLIVSIAQGVPVHDMLEIKSMLNGSKTLMIGPNTPGLITPEEARLGIFPENIHKKGSIGIMLNLFMQDDDTKAVVLIGKADNAYEILAAKYYASLSNKKPVIAFVAGEALPYHNYNMGYASDIITHGRITVSDKKRIMRESGMLVVDNMGQIHQILQELQL